MENRAQYDSLHRFAVTQRDLFKSCGTIPGARVYLRKLSDEGVRIRIITHRLFIHFFHRDAVSQTIDWLDDHGIPYWDLCFMKDKEQVGADIYVDDSPGQHPDAQGPRPLHDLLRQQHQQRPGPALRRLLAGRLQAGAPAR